MLAENDRQIVEKSLLLSKLPDDVLNALLSESPIRSYGRGEALFVTGEVAHSIFVLLNGCVKLVHFSKSGTEAVVGVFEKGGSFGEAAAFQDDVYPVTAQAVTDCRTLVISSHTLLKMMDARPELCRTMLSATLRHLHELVAQITQLKAQTGAQRVAEFLLGLCNAESGACSVTLPYEKILIAGHLGMKPESLSRSFGRLKESGVVVSQNKAHIDDVAALRNFVEQDRAEFWGEH